MIVTIVCRLRTILKKLTLRGFLFFVFGFVLDALRFSWWTKKTMLTTYLWLLIHYSSFSSDTKTLCTERAQVPIFSYWMRISRGCNVFHLWCCIKHKLRGWEVVQSTLKLQRYFAIIRQKRQLSLQGKQAEWLFLAVWALNVSLDLCSVSFAIKWRKQSLLLPQCFL